MIVDDIDIEEAKNAESLEEKKVVEKVDASSEKVDEPKEEIMDFVDEDLLSEKADEGAEEVKDNNSVEAKEIIEENALVADVEVINANGEDKDLVDETTKEIK